VGCLLAYIIDKHRKKCVAYLSEDSSLIGSSENQGNAQNRNQEDHIIGNTATKKEK
jgi:hypothetical protein